MTLINDQHMRSLGIPASGNIELVTATSDSGPTKCDTYDVSLRLESPDGPFILPVVQIVGRPFFHSVDGLIGRDILDHLTFTVIGREHKLIIEW